MIGPASGAPVALVIPWFGRDLRGGAELQAWNLAVRLAQRGYAVEVLTTCCASFQSDWATNGLPAGVTTEPEGFSIRRFPVEPRDRAAFDRVCGYLLNLPPDRLKPGVSPISPADERIFSEHLIRCPALLSHLKAEGWRYGAFIFLPYLYGPILDGLPLVQDRAFLQPCLHDEAYAYLHCVQRIVFAARKLFWLSEGEYELGQRLFGPSVITKSVVGMAGVETVLASEDNPSEIALPTRFVLLLGRKDAGKGTLHAVEAFRQFQDRNPSDLHLIVAGPGSTSLEDPAHRIIDLGLVSESMRCWLLRHAVALAQPSPNESFSRVIFEAWQCERPVIVRRICQATATAVRTSRGGWEAETLEEWSARYALIDRSAADELAEIGRRGAAFTRETADWDRVMDRYDRVLLPAVRAETIKLLLALKISVPKPQRIRLVSGLREIATWEASPGKPIDVADLEVGLTEYDPILHFETDEPAGQIPPDKRLLGFYIKHLAARTFDNKTVRLRFSKGWNRSESAIGVSNCRWSTGSADVVVDPHSPAIDEIGGIHQVLPNLAYGDAIGNHNFWIRDQLQQLGYNSEIFARHIAREVNGEAYALTSPDLLPKRAALIYHHSIGTEITPWVCGHPASKAIIYHNITPAEFFRHYRPELVDICRRGREELPRLAPYFHVSVGDSAHNAEELAETGFPHPGVLPLCIDPLHWAHAPDERVMSELQDGRINVLFVGRIVPNKRHEDLIHAFRYLRLRAPTAHLYLVGTAEVASFYQDCLQELAHRLKLSDAVHFIGRATDAELHAYYRCASLFWCASEHEGFCVPLVEAMWFDLPVLAYASTAIPETLAGAGCLYHTKDDPRFAADLAYRLIHDRPFREHTISGQRKRREAFLPEQVRPVLAQIAGALQPTNGSPALLNVGSPQTIAVVKLDHIGDLVLATPVFAALKRRFPQARITAVVTPAAALVLANNPHVDRILPYSAPWFWRSPPTGRKLEQILDANAATQRDLLAEKFDLVVNLRSDHENIPFAASIPHRALLSYTNDTDYAYMVTHPLLRTEAMHAMEQNRRLLAAIGVAEWTAPTLYPSAADRAAVEAAHLFAPGTVALFPGAGVPLKKWPVVKFSALARRLLELGLPVVVIGAQDEKEAAETIASEPGVINLCGRFTLLQLAAALSRCAALVSNDSAPVHLAAAMDTPVISITRPLVRDEFAPVGPHHLTCCAASCATPCGGFDPTKQDQLIDRCACIEHITVDEVLHQTLTAMSAHFARHEKLLETTDRPRESPAKAG